MATCCGRSTSTPWDWSAVVARRAWRRVRAQASLWPAVTPGQTRSCSIRLARDRSRGFRRSPVEPGVLRPHAECLFRSRPLSDRRSGARCDRRHGRDVATEPAHHIQRPFGIGRSDHGRSFRAVRSLAYERVLPARLYRHLCPRSRTGGVVDDQHRACGSCRSSTLAGAAVRRSRTRRRGTWSACCTCQSARALCLRSVQRWDWLAHRNAVW